MTMVGTVRRNKPELPPALHNTKDRDNFSSKFAFTDIPTLVSYCSKKKKNVLMMSTLHRDAAVSTREDRKLNAVLDYNRNKEELTTLINLMYFFFLSPDCFICIIKIRHVVW